MDHTETKYFMATIACLRAQVRLPTSSTVSGLGSKWVRYYPDGWAAWPRIFPEPYENTPIK